MENVKDIVDLAVATVTKENIPSEFTAADLENSLREQLSAFQDYKYLRKHAADLYEIIEEVANVVIPRKVLEQFGGFAEIRRKGYGEKISFTVRTGKYRGKKFVTKAGDQGIYKTFTLDNKELVMQPRVYAGATRLEIEDFLLGRISMSELLDVLTEALGEKLYIEIQKALIASFNAPDRPAANKYTGAGLIMDEFDKLINTVRAYGDSVNIYCTFAFASKLYNNPGWATVTNPNLSGRDVEDIRNQGYVGTYKGCNVIILNQSFTDDTNTETIVNDAYAYIMPAGAEKPVKIAFEGPTFVRNFTDAVLSQEISLEQMFDVAVLSHNYWAIYKDTSLEA
jgi:hypothetical protein